jgi:FixJ family two-component response regulator
MSRELTVFIVDDDAAVRDALGLLLGIQGYRVALFANSEDFLTAWKPDWIGCMVADIRMDGMDGLGLQQRLIARGSSLPVIIITGHADVSLARQAFKAKAIDFLEKPLDEGKLLHAVEAAFAEARLHAAAHQSRADAQQRLNELTPRELEVMRLVVAGHHNREVAVELGISPRTVEVHKAKLMFKLGVDNVADLVRISLALDLA